MANKLYEESSVEAIAQAIRTKNGLAATYKIGEMAAAILAIPQEGGGGTNYLPTVLNDTAAYSLPADALTGVTKIRAYSFYEAKVASVVFPGTLAEIGEYAFWGSSLAGAVDLPSSVTTIGGRAFRNLPTETFICRATTPPTLGTDVFGQSTATLRIYVPDASLSAYRSATGWTYYYNCIKPLSEYNP